MTTTPDNPGSPAEGRAERSRVVRQLQIAQWAEAAFGVEQTRSLPQRGLRLVEEAIEAAQAAGSSREMLHALVDYVYSRPVGKLHQELGGVAVCLLVLAEAAVLSAEQCERDEIERILSTPIEEFTKRNQAKNDAGFLANV